MVESLIFGAFGVILSWVFLYSAVYIGVKHALRDLSQDDEAEDHFDDAGDGHDGSAGSTEAVDAETPE